MKKFTWYIRDTEHEFTFLFIVMQDIDNFFVKIKTIWSPFVFIHIIYIFNL